MELWGTVASWAMVYVFMKHGTAKEHRLYDAAGRCYEMSDVPGVQPMGNPCTGLPASMVRHFWQVL
jgi:hypothetical protein